MLDFLKGYMERKQERWKVEEERETDISSIYKTVTWKVDFAAMKHRNPAEVDQIHDTHSLWGRWRERERERPYLKKRTEGSREREREKNRIVRCRFNTR